MDARDEKIVFEDKLLKRDVCEILNDRPVAHFKTAAIDKLVGGVKPRLTIISAEPGAGKTTLTLQMADELAEQGIPVLFFTFEIKRPLLLAKSLSRMSGGTLPIAAIPQVTTESCAALKAALDVYASKVAGNIAFIDKPCTPVEIAIMVGHVECELGIKPVVFLDYIQITKHAGERAIMDERSAVKETVAGLRHVVNGHDVPLFAISSVNRSTYKKDSAGLDSLAESSSLEYAADAVLFLAVKGKSDERTANMRKEVRPVTLAALKNRYGTTGAVDLMFDTQFARFNEA